MIDLSCERILVIGNSCAGKTTFSRRLGTLTRSPVIELDELHWSENWEEQPDDVFGQRVRAATAGPAWIADGNYSAIREILWPRATVAVWLNYRFPRVLWRGLRRSVRRSLTGEALWHGNRESWRRTFLSRDSILLWIIRTHRRRRRQFAELRRSDTYPHLHWVEFTAPAQADELVRRVAELPVSDRRTAFGA